MNPIEHFDVSTIGPNTRWLAGIWPLMESYGVTMQQCLEGLDISTDQATGREGGMSLEQEYALLRNLIRLSGDPLIGLKLGEIYQPQVYGIFGYALLSAPNLRMVLELVRNIQGFGFGVIEWVLESGEPAKYSQILHHDVPDDILQVFIDRNLAAGFTLLKSVGLQPSDVMELQMSHGGSAFESAYARFYGCPVSFVSGRCAFLFESQLLEQDLPWANEQAMEVCIATCQKLLSESRAGSELSSKVVDQIINTPGGFPACEVVAAQLGLSTRSMRRKLQQEGTSYNRLVQDVRLKLAKRYLKDRFTVEQTAELLGYSEASSFSRAFKGWTGQCPQEFRG